MYTVGSFSQEFREVKLLFCNNETYTKHEFRDTMKQIKTAEWRKRGSQHVNRKGEDYRN